MHRCRPVALHALDKRRGHCSDYHGFCASLGRAMGNPTRVTYGINPFPKSSPSHCKLEAYLPPFGWVSFDVSETQKLIDAIKKDRSLADEKKSDLAGRGQQRLLSGFRDNTWFWQTRGTDYELSPPAAKRAAVVRTIYAEADGERARGARPGEQRAKAVLVDDGPQICGRPQGEQPVCRLADVGINAEAGRSDRNRRYPAKPFVAHPRGRVGLPPQEPGAFWGNRRGAKSCRFCRL